jgi:putative ABC transport system ATP-binding protein
MTISISNLTKKYKQGNTYIEAVRGVNLTISPGEFIVLVGPSGGGKSTFLNLIGGIDRPTSGSIHFDDFYLETANEEQLTRFRREKIGFIFQFYNLLASLTALENVLLPLMARGINHGTAKKQAAKILTDMGLGHRLQHLPAQLSGGEQQRVAVSRAIIGKPSLVIADEPTGNLDSTSSDGIIQLLHELNEELGITFIVATHNLLLCENADRILEVNDGSIQEKGSGRLR